ncbi:MAG: chorismate mutase [Clostridia bacterium]|nr:chorismate mutase [Clostridia bacterium]
MSPMTLEEARAALDRIDAELVGVLLDRMRVSGEIAGIKSGTGQPVYSGDREDAILDRVYAQAAAGLLPDERREPAMHLRSLMRHVMQLSREYQYDILMPGTADWPIGRLIGEAPASLPAVRTVAVQGGPGSYQSMAASQLFPDAEQTMTGTFAESCSMVQDGRSDLAVLPLENTTAGTVDAVYDLLLRNELYIVASVSLPIVNCVMAPPGARIQDIRTVVSHPQALAQCAETIRSRGWESVASLNTAFAARDVAAAGDRTVAAIGSPSAARDHGLDILLETANDNACNQTRFVAVAPAPAIPPDATRISLILRLADRSGTLSSVLNIFADRGLNLAKIQSRPLPERPWEYSFYLDFEARAGDGERTLALVTMYQLEQEHPSVRFLGWYAGS